MTKTEENNLEEMISNFYYNTNFHLIGCTECRHKWQKTKSEIMICVDKNCDCNCWLFNELIFNSEIEEES